MSTKVTLNNITTGYSASDINDNLTILADAIDNTLSRDGTGPNQMTADLDMNSYRVLNLPEPSTNSEPARLQDVLNNASALNSATALSTSVSDIGNYYTGTDVENVLQELGPRQPIATNSTVSAGTLEIDVPVTTGTFMLDALYLTNSGGNPAVFLEAYANSTWQNYGYSYNFWYNQIGTTSEIALFGTYSPYIVTMSSGIWSAGKPYSTRIIFSTYGTELILHGTAHWMNLDVTGSAYRSRFEGHFYGSGGVTKVRLNSTGTLVSGKVNLYRLY